MGGICYINLILNMSINYLQDFSCMVFEMVQTFKIIFSVFVLTNLQTYIEISKLFLKNYSSITEYLNYL